MKWKVENMATKSEYSLIDDHIAKYDLIKEQYIASFNEQLSEYQRSMFFVVIPFFALCMMLLYFPYKRFYSEFLVYSIHFHSAYLILLPITIVLIIYLSIMIDKITGTSLAQVINNDKFISGYALLLMVAYHFIALKKVFPERVWLSLLKAVIFSCVNLAIMILLGQRILFWLTFKTV